MCKGSTADSDSVCEGSNPSPAATGNPETAMVSGLLYALLILTDTHGAGGDVILIVSGSILRLDTAGRVFNGRF